MGTVLVFRDDGRQPYAEVALVNGDRIAPSLDGKGMTIRHIVGGQPRILFRADPDVASRVCAGLIEMPKKLDVTPLQLVVAATVQLSSADEVESAFQRAADRLG